VYNALVARAGGFSLVMLRGSRRRHLNKQATSAIAKSGKGNRIRNGNRNRGVTESVTESWIEKFFLWKGGFYECFIFVARQSRR
jgi:hypothetical protein